MGRMAGGGGGAARAKQCGKESQVGGRMGSGTTGPRTRVQERDGQKDGNGGGNREMVMGENQATHEEMVGCDGEGGHTGESDRRGQRGV